MPRAGVKIATSLMEDNFCLAYAQELSPRLFRSLL